MQHPFDVITHWQRRLFGSKRLRPLEELCFEAWRHTLPERSRAILEAQLARVAYVERQAGGAKVIFRYPSGQPDVLFPNIAEDQVAARVVLGPSQGAAARHTFGARMFVHRGRLFSIEYPKRPDRLLHKHGLTEGQVRVLRVEPVQAIA